MQKNFNPDLFVAKLYCSRVGPEHMPEFAADALEAGYDGPALRRLSGLIKPTKRDVGDLFQKALSEIGTIKITSKEQAIFFFSRTTASDIVEGRLDPILGTRILARYAMMAEYPPGLTKFLQLADMPDWGKYAPPRDKLVQEILEEARKLLAREPE